MRIPHPQVVEILAGEMKLNPKVLPTILIIIDLLAAVGYLPCGDWRKVTYWTAAAVLTFVVTY